MPDGQPKTIDAIKAQYRNLDGQHQYGLSGLKAAVWEYELGFHADKLCRDFDFNIILFGHTHREKIDKDFLFTDNRVYANTGAWCEENANCVIIEKYPLKSGITVKLVDVGVNGSITDTRTRHL
ncbi:MAG: hypothetical protein CL608_22310 [Anaerolineaceae bacterium]|nr:hypothetical protein [Anaerolineaceae bacterium]